MQIQKKIKFDSQKRRGLDEALEYVSKAWFPVNTALLSVIQNKLKNGEYEKQPSQLLEDLKGDLALYTHCVRRLKDLADSASFSKAPSDLLTSLQIEELRKVLEVPEDQISTHKLDVSMKPQMVSLRHALVSSSTAEALAEKADVDSEMTFLCSSIRQLGINLVAWNYPRIYSKALQTSRQNEEDLDAELLKVLAYSPLHLGLKAALDWNTCPHTRCALGWEGFETEAPSGAKGSKIGQMVRRFCELGEAVARVNDPEHFPGAVKDWDRVVGEIRHYLGPDGLSYIAEKFEKNSAAYQSVSAPLFKLEISPEKTLKIAQSQYAQKLFGQNSYVQKCPILYQERFKEVYEAMVNGRVSSKALNILVSNVVPLLGFTRGCVYLADVHKGALVPMLRIGDCPLSRYRVLNYADAGAHPHPAVAALSYSAPIVEEKTLVHDDRVSHVTGVFGNREKTGVLYLEMSDELSNGERHLPLLYFKAVRECLNDCLNLH